MIQRGDCAAASRLAADDISPNVKDDDSVPALMLATLCCDAAYVERLLQRGADPNQADNTGASTLLWAMPELATWEPDAYATGLSLFAIHEAGVAVTDDVYLIAQLAAATASAGAGRNGPSA